MRAGGPADRTVAGRPRRSSGSLVVTAGRVRRRRRRLRLRQHGQPARVPRRRHEVDHARHRRASPTSPPSPRRRRPRCARGSTTSSWSGSATRSTRMHAVCAHAGGPLAEGTVVDGCLAVPVARLPVPADRRPRRARPVASTTSRRTRSGRPRAAATRSGAGSPDVSGPSSRRARLVELPDPSLVVLVGAAGSGKSTFAARHFAPDEVLSSDAYRARDRGRRGGPAGHRPRVPAACTATSRPRLRRAGGCRRRRHERDPRTPGAALLARARGAGVPAVAIVLDLPPAVVHARNAGRADARRRPRRSSSASWRRLRTVDARRRSLARRGSLRSSSSHDPAARRMRSRVERQRPVAPSRSRRARADAARSRRPRARSRRRVVAGHPLAQEDRREDHRRHRVQRRQDRRDRQRPVWTARM